MEEYNYQLNVVWTRWSAYSNLKEFQDYFWKEWVTGRFNKWQIWNTPCPGVATTNSCIESFNKQVKFVYTGYELYSIVQFGDICFDKIVNHYSVQPKEFKFYREPTYDMIVKANEILTNGSDPIVSGGLNIYLIRSQSRPAVNYRLVVEDNQTYSGFKFVYCTCISKFNLFNQNYLIFCLFFKNFNIKGYHACYTCKHIVALAMRDKFRIKGFIPIETLVPNNKSGRRKALTLQGKAANLTPNKSTKLRNTYKRK
jgi:hypothetical protein